MVSKYSGVFGTCPKYQLQHLSDQRSIPISFGLWMINMGLSENSVPLHPMVLLIIIPIKWLFHWEYTLFSDKPISILIRLRGEGRLVPAVFRCHCRELSSHRGPCSTSQMPRCSTVGVVANTGQKDGLIKPENWDFRWFDHQIWAFPSCNIYNNDLIMAINVFVCKQGRLNAL